MVIVPVDGILMNEQQDPFNVRAMTNLKFSQVRHKFY